MSSGVRWTYGGLTLGLRLVEELDGEGWKGRWNEERLSRNLSSCSLARAVACKRDIGWRANTSRRSSGFNPEMKQLNKNGGGSPTTRLANLSNSVK